jgi:hypothetical protein
MGQQDEGYNSSKTNSPPELKKEEIKQEPPILEVESCRSKRGGVSAFCD